MNDTSGKTLNGAVRDSLQPLSDSLKSVDLTGHPPVERWNPSYEGEIDIVIKADGTWLHEGDPFRRDSLVKLFASVLWFENGEHYLKTPAEKMRITVEEAAFFIPLLEVVGEGESQQLVFISSYGDRVVANEVHRIEVEEDPMTGEPRPYLTMRYGMRGKLSRNVFYQLAEMATPHVNDDGQECLQVFSSGIGFVLGNVD